MSDPLLIAKGIDDLLLLPEMANRHGLVAGATGTGKTVTLQVMAESFSRIGVPVFAADVKGDLSGISMPGTDSPKLQDRITKLGLADFRFAGCPVTFWDVFGKEGHPVRATVSEMGPLLLSRILNLNDTQNAVLSLVFKIADDNGLLLLDLKDLQAMLQNVGTNAKQYQVQYGNISAASIGAIQRGLVSLGTQGGDQFLGEPALNIDDLLQTDSNGRGVVNLLAAGKLMQAPQLYATMLLWLLSELYEKLPEAGDLPKPKLVFFFDEAHLLFNDLPPVLQSKIEQVIRLIRSKAVGVYFVTQNPTDVPDIVLSQLGNRVQHALRAFTPRDQKAVRAAAETFRSNPALDVSAVITQLEVGEALVSFLDGKGTPGIVERALVCPPHGQIGPITPEERQRLMATSLVAGVYEQAVDRESAYEILRARATGQPLPSQIAARAAAAVAASSSYASDRNAPAGYAPANENPTGASTSAPIPRRAPAPPASPAYTPVPPLSPGYTPAPPPPPAGGGLLHGLESMMGGLGNMLSTTGPRGGHTTTPVGAMVNSASRAIGSQVGRELIRGVLGSLMGGGSSRRPR